MTKEITTEIGVNPGPKSPSTLRPNSKQGGKHDIWRRRLVACVDNPETWVKFGPFAATTASSTGWKIRNRVPGIDGWKFEVVYRTENKDDPEKVASYVYVRYHPDAPEPKASPVFTGDELARRRKKNLRAARRNQEAFIEQMKADRSYKLNSLKAGNSTPPSDDVIAVLKKANQDRHPSNRRSDDPSDSGS